MRRHCIQTRASTAKEKVFLWHCFAKFSVLLQATSVKFFPSWKTSTILLYISSHHRRERKRKTIARKEKNSCVKQFSFSFFQPTAKWRVKSFWIFESFFFLSFLRCIILGEKPVAHQLSILKNLNFFWKKRKALELTSFSWIFQLKIVTILKQNLSSFRCKFWFIPYNYESRLHFRFCHTFKYSTFSPHINFYFFVVCCSIVHYYTFVIICWRFMTFEIVPANKILIFVLSFLILCHVVFVSLMVNKKELHGGKKYLRTFYVKFISKFSFSLFLNSWNNFRNFQWWKISLRVVLRHRNNKRFSYIEIY